MKGAPPLRFLALVVGGWVCARAAILSPLWFERTPDAVSIRSAPYAASVPPSIEAPATTLTASLPALSLARSEAPMVSNASLPLVLASPTVSSPPGPPVAEAPYVQLTARAVPPAALFEQEPAPVAEPFRTAPAILGISQWSASAWAFVRRGSGAALAAGGMLGGSQAGGRITYRLNDEPLRPLSLSARLYSPIGRKSGSEAALGFEWKPAAALPVRLLAERRVAIGKEGRSALGLMAHGGVSEAKVGPLRADVYAQAGVVGAKSRDLFADGSATLGLPIDEDGALKIGGGVWGAAQPGVSRLDAGPQVSWRLPVSGPSMRVSADWRMRVAGDAAPGSGPTITLSTDF